MNAPGLREEVRGEALWWILDNPRRRNAVHPDALRWMTRRCAALDGEVVVLTGAGDEAFCAGFDLTALTPQESGPAPDAPLAEAAEAIEQADATFIAAINGFAIGAGLELACACDLRVAREDAWVSIPAARLGVVYHAAGLRRLHAILGPAVMQRLLLLGERVDADGLLEAGALGHVAAPASLQATVEAVITAIAAGDPLSQRAHRSFLRALEGGGTDPALLARHERARDEAYARIREKRARSPEVE